jgi:hypothetical protein
LDWWLAEVQAEMRNWDDDGGVLRLSRPMLGPPWDDREWSEELVMWWYPGQRLMPVHAYVVSSLGGLSDHGIWDCPVRLI